jgi:nucleotide-binding universal stress UspA family protein
MTVVVGYVPTPEGRAALERAVEEARLRAVRLVVVNSSRGDAYVDPHFVSAADLADLDELLDRDGVGHEVRQPVHGREPVEELDAVVREVDADLLVIGLRRRTPVGKFLLGSDAQRILLGVDCPVLAVKP